LKLATNIATGKAGATRLSIWGLVEVAGILLCLATIAGFLARLWWVCELTSHFRLHLAIALAAIAALWVLKCRWRRAAVCFAFATVNAGLVVALFWPIADKPLGSGGRLRIVSVNVHTENERTDLLLEFLRGADADVVLLMEVNDRWITALSPLDTSYPHRIAEVREDNFGIALFSRMPLTNASVVEIGNAGVPSVIADVTVNEQTIHLVGTHPLPPGSSENARLRNEQMTEVANHVRNQQTPAIVFGDLNVTPWSPYFADLLRDSRLKDTSRGRGLFGSWPAWLPFLRIPLDHCLASPFIHVADRHLGPQLHSDHLPLVIDLVITRGQDD
jgi:endonuclease/exonuclease/phosphatase (EEP) superfamily protein YafD